MERKGTEMEKKSQATKIHHDQSEMNTLFIHSAIDDAGLSVHEFRLVCHLARRTGKGEAFPSAESMAKVCRMKRDTVFAALKGLAERNIVTLKRRKGQSSVYTINKPSRWKEPVPRNGATPKGGASPETGLHQSPETGLPPAPNGGTLRISHEGNPSEGDPINPPNPPKGEKEKAKKKAKSQTAQSRFTAPDERLKRLCLAYRPRGGGMVAKNEIQAWKNVVCDFDPDNLQIESCCQLIRAFLEGEPWAEYCPRQLLTFLNKWESASVTARKANPLHRPESTEIYKDGDKW